MSIVLTAPQDSFPILAAKYTPSVFMAGGISNCHDWQQEYIEKTKDVDAIFINPRRYDFDITDPNQSEIQIEWEHSYLEVSDIVSFWFPSETLCPITLFELGKMSQSSKTIIVGTHPEYARKYDVIKQLSLIDPTIKVVHTLDDLIYNVKLAVLNMTEEVDEI